MLCQVDDTRTGLAVGVQEVAACERLIVRALLVTVTQRQLEIDRLLTLPLRLDALHDGSLDSGVDLLDGHLVVLGDNDARAKLRIRVAVNADSIPYMRIRQAALAGDNLGRLVSRHSKFLRNSKLV